MANGVTPARVFIASLLVVAAIFDADERKVGQQFGDLSISSMDSLSKIASEQDIKLAIMSVPAEAAPDLLVLGANPLDDIRNTRKIEAVFIAGNKVH